MTDRDDLIEETHETDVFAAFEGDVPIGSATPSALRDFGGKYLPALLAFLVVIVAWEGLTRALKIETFVLPKPSEIMSSFIDTWGTVWGAGFRTLKEALGGFALGVTGAVLTSFAAARWVRFREGMLPVAIAMNAMPIVALAPIFNNWFGLTNPLSKIGVVAIVVYFPVMINTTRGLLEVGAKELELMKSVAATPAETMRRVRIPNALPFYFASLKVASTLSLIAAVVAEYFGGPQDVLGQYIINRANLFQFADAWAAILVASIVGVVFYVLILAAERVVMPWHVSIRSGG